MRRSIVMRSLKVGIFVGTALTLINQGDVLFSGQFPPALVWKVPLTYLTPYLVSTFASVQARRNALNN